MTKIDSLEICTMTGFVEYTHCLRCDQEERDGCDIIGERPWVICSNCYIEWLIGERVADNKS